MSSVFLIIQVLLAVILTIVILLQKSASMGLGAYSGSNESLFGAKGPAGFLAKLTFALGLLFVLNTIALGYLYMQDTKRSIIDNVGIPKVSVPLVPNSTLAEPSSTPTPVNSEPQ